MTLGECGSIVRWELRRGIETVLRATPLAFMFCYLSLPKINFETLAQECQINW